MEASIPGFGPYAFWLFTPEPARAFATKKEVNSEPI
jgi:hypothetical protein